MRSQLWDVAHQKSQGCLEQFGALIPQRVENGIIDLSFLRQKRRDGAFDGRPNNMQLAIVLTPTNSRTLSPPPFLLEKSILSYPYKALLIKGAQEAYSSKVQALSKLIEQNNLVPALIPFAT